MRIIAVVALSAAILVGGSAPVSAFDTPNFSRHAIAWQNKTKAAMNDMRPNAASITRTLVRVDRLAVPYYGFIAGLAPNQCQMDNGFPQHKQHVLRYAAAIRVALRYMRAGNTNGTVRLFRVAVNQYKAADEDGARVLRECW